jgi:hypothetical protein
MRARFVIVAGLITVFVATGAGIFGRMSATSLQKLVAHR